MVDDLLQAVEEMTSQVIERLQATSIEELEQLVQLRDQLTVEIEIGSRQATPEQKIMAARILRHDEMILNRMHELQNDASVALRKIQISTIQKNAYTTEGPVDSFMFDRKK